MGVTVTSFYFLCFLAGALLLYYVVPKKIQWCVLLLAGISYYLLSGNGVLIAYPILGCLVAWGGAYAVSKFQKPKLYLTLTVALLIGTLFVLKYVNFISNTVNAIGECFGKESILPTTSFLVPLGISFYTFTILGYVIDVYNRISPVQTNYFKFLTFGMYFAPILSGPIMKYREDGEQFFKPHYVNYHNLTFGAQRILWGFFKTIVISERTKLIADTVYNNPSSYYGIWVILATVCYAFTLYTNFSGCMDIVIGISQMFDLILPENFDTPFFAKTISEYWRRWHITLGVWMKEYVFYPLLRTKGFGSLQKRMKNRFGKKTGKMLTTFIAMFILWFTVGIWHGGDWKYVIGSGLLHWLYIVLGEVLMEPVTKLLTKIHINPQSKWLDVLRIVRTFTLACIGFVFFRANSFSDACLLIKNTFALGNIKELFTSQLFSMGLDWIEFVIMIVSLGVMTVVSVMSTKGSVRERIASRKLPIRWLIWYALLFYTILLGYYGPGFSASEFIYQGF